MFIEQEIRILEWFLKNHVTLKSNDAENIALITEINYILKYIKIEISYWNSKNISKFCCTLDQINAGLVSGRAFFKKHKKSSKLLTGSVYCNNLIICINKHPPP